jgi:hypothetical protein
MPLAAAKPGLQSDIEAAFLDVLNAGKEDGASPEGIIAQLAADLANAIDTYTTSALVITDPGQMVNTAVVTAGSPAAQAGTGIGATTASGTGSLT